MEGIVGAESYRLQIVDYVVLAVILIVSAASGIYVSTVKHKQTSVVEYFLAGRNAPSILVLLSFFSSFAAGGMTGIAIEVYAFGAQSILGILISIPVCCLWLYFLIVPVFYKLQNISMLKYFEIRFGSIISVVGMVAVVLLMVAIGAVNIYVASITIYQVSDMSFWTAAIIMTVVCIIYSSLGGMRGIVLADSIQAVVMIIAVLFIFIMGIIRNGGLSAIWGINSEHGRLLLIDWSTDPTLRHTFWVNVFGYPTIYLAFILSNQTLLQRCIMAPSLKAAQKIATLGAFMTFLYILIFQGLGLIIFAYYSGCDLVESGSVKSLNQIIAYFAMEILHDFPGFAGIFFSGILCATLSTVSSFLNSISALIMSPILHKSMMKSDRLATLMCKILVLVFGTLMTLGLIIIDNFHNFIQAAYVLLSVISGPTLALYCLGILCPQAKSKCVTIAYAMGLSFGMYMLIGTFMTSYVDLPLPFATCNSTQELTMANATVSNLSDWQKTINSYFPLAQVSYAYMCLELCIITIIFFVVLSMIMGPQKQWRGEVDLDLIPNCVQRLQLKFSVKLRRLLLCDVYCDSKEHQLMETLKPNEPT